VFVNYRRDDAGWAATVTADALRRRLGPAVEVFLDNRSIRLGTAFAGALEDGVRRSAVLLVLIGPRWDRPPLRDRLQDRDDWVRTEILLAREHGATVVPVLVDRADVPEARDLPEELRFLPGLQVGRIRQNDDRDPDVLAERIAALLPLGPRGAAPSTAGTERTRAALGAFLRGHLPRAQQWSGNRDRLVNLALAVLGPEDRLTFAALARINDGPPGSATVFVTATDVVVVEVGEDFLVRGEIRFPRTRIRRIEVVSTLPLFADAVVHTTAGDAVRLQGLFRGQAAHFADHLRA
jgi:hypothetical protein